MKFSAFFLVLMCLFSCEEKKTNSLPSFDLTLLKTKTIFNTNNIPKGKPFIIMYFSPDCEHCQQETVDLIHHIKEVASINFYMITNDPIERLNVYNDYYKIYKYNNIILTRDHTYFFLNTYKPKYTPYIAIFDKSRELKVVYDGGAQIDTIIQVIKQYS